MLNFFAITIQTENGERDIYVSPLLLQAKEPPNLKSGPLHKLYFYKELNDADYKAKLAEDEIGSRFKKDNYIINLGQDFEKYYLGSLNVDFETKRYWQWEGKLGSLTQKEVKSLGESLFNSQGKSRSVILFTPTRPSDFNFGIARD
jgi:hypothetical protein